VLEIRARVGDDPGAGLQQRHAVVQHDRPDRDAGVHRAAGEDIADGTGVRPAPVALELGDDLHRSHLRGARDGAGRKARTQEAVRADPLLELAGDLRDEVGHVGEPLRLEEALDPHRSGPADAGEVVAAEVDEHDVLGAVLLRGEQTLGVTLAGAGRARDRIEAGPAVLALDERLRRRADEREAVELEQEEVRRGVHAPQRAVERERVDRRLAPGPLRHDDLKRVAALDGALRVLDGPLIAEAPRRAERRAAPVPVGRARDGERTVEPLADLVRIAAEHLREPEHVVEPDQRLRDDEAALRQLRPGVRQRHGGLERCRVVVADVADDRLAAGFGLGEVDDPRAAADERVSAEPAALDRLEQEARAPLPAQPDVCPERADEIGIDDGRCVHVGQTKRPSERKVFERNGLCA
jgi:hypothetical protein